MPRSGFTRVRMSWRQAARHELEEGYELDSEDLRAFFYPRARDFVRPIASNGEFWPAMRAARPAWFGGKEE